jgi:hypothetical protein
VKAPLVIRRPIAPLYPASHSAPSGPDTIPTPKSPGAEYCVIAPAVGMRPTIPSESSVGNHSAPSGPTAIAVGPPNV